MSFADRCILFMMVAASSCASAGYADAGFNWGGMSFDAPSAEPPQPPAAIPQPDDAGPQPPDTAPQATGAPPPAVVHVPHFTATPSPRFAELYQPMDGDKFPVPGVPKQLVRKGFERQEVDYVTKEPPGTIVVDPHAHYLYYVEEGGRAMRYGVGVGKQGFSWSGEAFIKSKQEWPDWYPPKEMIERHPELKPQLDQLQSGMGVSGGYRNPLGARAMYLWQGNKDTYFRIHGTLEPHSIGTNASSGCIRMINQDAIDLYARVKEGTRVVVLGSDHPTIGVSKPPS